MSDMSTVIILICFGMHLISAISINGQYYYVNTYVQRPASRESKTSQFYHKTDYKLVGLVGCI